MKWICKICDYQREDEPKEEWDKCPNCDSFSWMREGDWNDKKWTTKKPVENGYYWCYTVPVFEDDPEVFCVNVWIDPNSNEVNFDIPCDGLEREETICANRTTHWMGPLHEPAPPVAHPATLDNLGMKIE